MLIVEMTLLCLLKNVFEPRLTPNNKCHLVLENIDGTLTSTSPISPTLSTSSQHFLNFEFHTIRRMSHDQWLQSGLSTWQSTPTFEWSLLCNGQWSSWSNSAYHVCLRLCTRSVKLDGYHRPTHPFTDDIIFVKKWEILIEKLWIYFSNVFCWSADRASTNSFRVLQFSEHRTNVPVTFLLFPWIVIVINCPNFALSD